MQKRHLVGSSRAGCRDLRHRWGGVAGWGLKRWFVHSVVHEMPSLPSCGKSTKEEKKGFNPSRRTLRACMCTYAQVCREGGGESRGRRERRQGACEVRG